MEHGLGELAIDRRQIPPPRTTARHFVPGEASSRQGLFQAVSTSLRETNVRNDRNVRRHLQFQHLRAYRQTESSHLSST
eukprot:2179255-Pyramimonas_sp.AAC.1